jgi:hypothetical protein
MYIYIYIYVIYIYIYIYIHSINNEPKDDDFVFPQTVDYTCNTGYSYDAKYQKDDKNKQMQTECKSDGLYKDFDTCKAIRTVFDVPGPEHGGLTRVFSRLPKGAYFLLLSRLF